MWKENHDWKIAFFFLQSLSTLKFFQIFFSYVALDSFVCNGSIKQNLFFFLPVFKYNWWLALTSLA